MNKKAPILKITPEQLSTVRISDKTPKLSKTNPSTPKKVEGSNLWKNQRLIINK